MEFSPSKNNKLGVRTNCKQCGARLAKEKRMAFPEKQKEANKKYREKDIDKFNQKQRESKARYKEKRNKETREWHSKNKEHNKEYCRNYYQENIEYMFNKNKKWRHENPERVKELRRIYRLRKLNSEGFHTENDWNAVKNLFGNKCLICGNIENITEDHIIPLFVGGTDSIFNIQPLCKSCNSKKHIKIIDYRVVTDVFVLTKMYF